MELLGRNLSRFRNNVARLRPREHPPRHGGGAIFNLANLLLVAAIDLAGLAIAFPGSIGIALVVGVVLSFALQAKGNASPRSELSAPSSQFHGPVSGHVLGALGEVIWGIGMVFHFVAPTLLGWPSRRRLTSPLPWWRRVGGVFAWREFTGPALRRKLACLDVRPRRAWRFCWSRSPMAELACRLSFLGASGESPPESSWLGRRPAGVAPGSRIARPACI